MKNQATSMPQGCDSYTVTIEKMHAHFGLSIGAGAVFAVAKDKPGLDSGVRAGDLVAIWSSASTPLLARVLNPALAEKRGPMLLVSGPGPGAHVALYYSRLKRVDKLVEVRPPCDSRGSSIDAQRAVQ